MADYNYLDSDSEVYGNYDIKGISPYELLQQMNAWNKELRFTISNGLEGVETKIELLDGEIRLEVLDQLEGLSSEISVLAEGIELKADAQAVTDLGSIVSQAQIDISGLESAINLKADAQIVTDLGMVLSQAQIDISGLQAAIVLKADALVVDNMGGRLNSAELNINAISGSISSMVSKTDFNGNTIASLIAQSAEAIDVISQNINLVGAVNVLSDITGNLGTITSGTILIDTNATVGNNLDIGRLYDSGEKNLTFRSALGSANITFRPQYDDLRIGAINSVSLSSMYLNLTEIDNINWGTNKPTGVWG